jgi:hypothetical protein
MKYFIHILFSLTCCSFSDIKSLDGHIKFDVQNDGQTEMTLNTIGLGIGTTPTSNLHVQGNAIITQQLFVGSTSGTANLNIQGSLGFSSQTTVTNSNLDDHSIYLADTSNDNLLLQLPYAGNVSGRKVTVKKTSTSNKLWLVAQGGNLLDNERSLELPEGSFPYASLISNGTQWYTTSTSDVLTGIASDNLVGWWKLNEISSTNLINENDLYPSLIFTTSDIANSDPTIGPGLFDQAINLDGNGDNFYMIGSSASMPYFDNATQISMSIWVKVDDLDSDGTIISKGDFATDNAFMLWRDETAAASGRTDTYSIIVSDGTNHVRLEGVSNLSLDDDWHHIVVTYKGDDSTGLRLYIDGVEDANSPGDTSNVDNLDSNADFFRLGRTNNTNEIDGSLDEFRIFNRVLSADEVQAIYGSGP